MSSPSDLERVRALTSSSVTDLVQTPVTQLDLVRGLWTSRRLVQAAVLWPVLLSLASGGSPRRVRSSGSSPWPRPVRPWRW